MSCIQISVPFTQYESTTYKSFREVDLQNRPKPYSQCIGFAAKLQEDIFQTADIVRFEMLNGQYQVLDGSWQTYQPKKGDSVRLDHEHSIFITNVFSSGITFAQCNANNQCEIDWDATKYKGQTVTAAYLRQHATYVERPVLAGDLNLDGTIDSADAAIFADTMMTNGSRIGTTPDSTLDANSDLRIDEQDYICRTRLRSEDIWISRLLMRTSSAITRFRSMQADTASRNITEPPMSGGLLKKQRQI